MKKILLAATVLMSLNTFAQEATELTREQKEVAFEKVGNFLPFGDFKGNILGKAKNPWTVHRCVGGVTGSKDSLAGSLRENKVFPLEAFVDDYHPNNVGVVFMSIDDKVTNATWSDNKAAITSRHKNDSYTTTLEMEKLEDNKVNVIVTYTHDDGRVQKSGCELKLDKPFKE